MAHALRPGFAPGDTITPYYDPMIAKIVVHGATRALALARLRAALRQTEVAGTVTNLGFLSRLAEHEGFERGAVDTGLIARHQVELTQTQAPEPEIWTLAAVAAFGQDAAAAPLAGFSLWAPSAGGCHVEPWPRNPDAARFGDQARRG